MFDNNVMGRMIKITDQTGTIRCDFDHKIIPKGKVGYRISVGIAQGTYHGSTCYASARKHYQELHNKFVPPEE